MSVTGSLRVTGVRVTQFNLQSIAHCRYIVLCSFADVYALTQCCPWPSDFHFPQPQVVTTRATIAQPQVGTKFNGIIDAIDSEVFTTAAVVTVVRNNRNAGLQN